MKFIDKEVRESKLGTFVGLDKKQNGEALSLHR